MTPTPTPPMDERRLALAKAYAAGVRGQMIPDGSTLVAELLAEVDRLREAGARETALPNGPRYVKIDDTVWPRPDTDIGWLLRYGTPSPNDLMFAASVAAAYAALIAATSKRRSEVVSDLRAARTPSPGDRAQTADGEVSAEA